MECHELKAVILAGGLGTRMQDLTRLIPKPMIEIGTHPILWHVMKVFDHGGVGNFCVALGYRSEIVKEYFANYRMRNNSTRIDLRTGIVEVAGADTENWIVDLVETGALTQTGGRIARLKSHLAGAPFFLTYGDGIADVDIAALYAFHKSHGRIATVTAVRPPSRFGALDIGPDGRVGRFTEKPVSGDTWISGGFFVFEPGIFDYLSTDEDCVLERSPLERLAADGELVAYQHRGFWQGIDTARDVELVNRLWESGTAPWKLWDQGARQS